MGDHGAFRYLHATEAAPPEWFSQVWSVFSAEVLDPEYPCYFGTEIVRAGDLFVTTAGRDDLEHLPHALGEFIETARTFRGRRNNFAVFFQPEPDLEHDQYRERFWQVLQYLHDHDALPEAVPPRDASHALWEFPFGGEQFFVVGICPTYRQRRSRNLGPSLVLLFQPRDVFVGAYAGGAVDAKSREFIRRRLSAWDSVGPHPDLGYFGDQDNREWKQYFLPDGNAQERGRCPLHQGGTSENARPVVTAQTSAAGAVGTGDSSPTRSAAAQIREP